jgi:FMN hydrolase / 5-amino-6-(5-phospho-D-ribitylamino)uracil phosphatase
MFSQLRLICFDLDNTFWPIDPVIRAADQAVEQWLQVHYPALAAVTSPASLREARFDLARQHPDQAHDLTWLRIEALARCALAHGLPATVGREGFEVFIAARHRVEFYPDVLPALEVLGRNFRLATLSNGNADIRRIGAAQRFEFSLNAGLIGYAKPDPRAFQMVLDLSGCHPTQVLYVGDDPDHDIAGPQRLGLRTAWLRRDQARDWPAGLTAPDVVLATLADLVSALRCVR